MTSTVPSVEPPSIMMYSIGTVWASNTDRMAASIVPAWFKQTVTMVIGGSDIHGLGPEKGVPVLVSASLASVGEW